MSSLKEFNFIQLFVGLMHEYKPGRRLKKDGKKIRPCTIEFYDVVYRPLHSFVAKEADNLRIRNINRFTTRQMNAETKYWKRFYKYYSYYLYSQGSYGNYVVPQFTSLRSGDNVITEASWGIGNYMDYRGYGQIGMIGLNVTTPTIAKVLSFTINYNLVVHHAELNDFSVTDVSTGVTNINQNLSFTTFGTTPSILFNFKF